ncbi:60S ribosomal protein L22 [Schistosoma japonicum]|uniref:Large ribosomal subunit protein eL22 n=1 Tax=Schistosoma japonicum TaxID=6182 RepID=Q5DCV8_SCHJA|nr:SJCHGC02419 protein [Schistosoma japonicum]KAH8869966.1 60S ribosomal protein L22 [Schistosoma japonicum]CAX70037.1 heparin binding protein [Schistosoma japonicum]CAX71837.1 heparin binding protein [Schistosoma japonicum]CAX71838.1 heparin binding protein [Schistosoma japonicum]
MVVSKSVPKPKSHKPALKKKQALKFSICCSPGVIDEDIISPGILEKYLKEHIKVNKKLNNLGKDIHIERDKSTINITANIPFSKRYLKYLTKKFLKRHKLRDFLRVVAKSKDSYELRFFNFENEDTDDEEES